MLPFVGFELTPGSFKSPACRGDGTVDVLGITFRNRCQRFARDGLILSKVLPEAASTHCPLMSMRLGRPSRKAGRIGMDSVGGVTTVARGTSSGVCLILTQAGQPILPYRW